jgi:hypothetical protein
MGNDGQDHASQVDDGECALPVGLQTRNAVLFGSIWAMIYFGAPVLYIGLTQGALLKRLGANDAVANLPGSFYLFCTPLPVLFAWYFCHVRQLRAVLVATYGTIAALGAMVAAALALNLHPWIVIGTVFIHSAVLGCALGVSTVFQWEVIGRGVSLRRRGQALGLAFGVGPIMAFASSLLSQLVLTGRVEIPWFTSAAGLTMVPLRIEPIEYPWNFACLFGATAPLAAACALLSSFFVVPQPANEAPRKPFIAGVFGGFGDFLSDRLIRRAVIANILVYSGYSIITNVSLYTEQAIGAPAEDFVGYQNALRFGCKIVAGLALGWILTKSNPRNGQLATTTLLIAGVLCAILAPGKWFFLSFGLLGAGELFGVYYPNYIVCCSPKSQMRRNMAFVSLITMPAFLAPLLFGQISDTFGYHASFWTALAMLVGVFGFVRFALPPQPAQPTES